MRSHIVLAILFASVLASTLAASHWLLRSSASFEALSFEWLSRVSAALGLYFFVFILYSNLLRRFEISLLYPIYTGLSIVLVTLIGVYYYGEPLSLWRQAGVFLIAAGIVLMSF
jgi:small multidrug resistance pump